MSGGISGGYNSRHDDVEGDFESTDTKFMHISYNVSTVAPDQDTWLTLDVIIVPTRSVLFG